MWRFIQFADTHLGGNTDGVGNHRLIRTLMPGVIGCLRQDIQELRPEFLVPTGDITSIQTRDAMFAARDLLDSLRTPYLPVGGNSDFQLEQSRSWFVDAFQAWLPIRDTVYSVTHRGVHFCILDPWWRWPDGTLCPFAGSEEGDYSWGLPPHQIDWLKHNLNAHSTLPTIIVCHVPTTPLPARFCREGSVDRGSLWNGELFLDQVMRHKQVKAIFSGHSHINYVERINGLTQVVTGALLEYPVEYRDIHVGNDGLEIHTRGLSDATYAARSLVEGMEWTAGEPADRTATIAF